MSNPRRIIAAIGPDGKSCVVSDEAIPLNGNPQTIAITNVWSGAAVRVDNTASCASGFAPFAMNQLSDAAYSLTIAEYAPGVGAVNPGMHFTETADHFYVIAGEVVMVLEHDEVVLRTGDIGIIRGAAHGWRNDGGEVARLVFFVLPAEPLAR